MKIIHSFLLAFCSVSAILSFCSCNGINDDGNGKVALILPSGATVSRWSIDAACLEKSLKAYGYDVQLFTVEEDENGADQQVKQIESVIKQGICNLVITPVDYAKINASGILEQHQECNFICYDRMIMDNSAVDFYVSCDPVKIGETQAQYLLEKAGDNAMTIEYFAGPKTDKNAVKYFDGAYDLLKKVKTIVSASGIESYDEAALPSWSSEDARTEMTARLNETHTIPDLVLAPNDNVANGVIEAIEAYQPGIAVFPAITGQDKTDEAVANIKAGKQAMTIYKEYENMAETAAMVVNSFISGKAVVTGTSVNNGKKEVPTKYTNFTLVTIHNIDAE